MNSIIVPRRSIYCLLAVTAAALLLGTTLNAPGQTRDNTDATNVTPVEDTILDQQTNDENIETVLQNIDLSVEGTARFIEAIWRYPLFNSGGDTIRLNQIIIAILIVLIGAWISKYITRMIRLRLMKFKRMDAHVAAVIQKFIFYMMLTIIILIALPMAGIPITIFTVLGGALAIGIGFGAQNLFNNVISGLIIMTERPIRLGDIVETGGELGRVAEIGNRCTRVRRFDGIDVLIPNSKFLEENVINWTLHDDLIRGSVTVGVAYGSPTDEVARLIRQAVDEHDNIKKQPEPIVLFQEFGDNSLNFEVFFWMNVNRPMDIRIIRSDVRFRIDQLFRNARITIAFPQRDVHLDSLKPVEVRLVNEANT